LLSLLRRGIVSYPGGEVAYSDKLLTRPEQALYELLEVKPEISSAVLPDTEVQVETIDVGSHPLG